MKPNEFRALVEEKAKAAKIPFRWLPDGNAMVIYPNDAERFATLVNEVAGGDYKADVTGEFINPNDNNGGANDFPDNNNDNGNWNSGYTVTTNDD